jgi:hypothetical protein
LYLDVDGIASRLGEYLVQEIGKVQRAELKLP